MADKYMLRIDQGSDFALELEWQDPDGNPIDLTGYSAALQIRTAFKMSVAEVSLTDGDGLTLGGADGTIAIAIPAGDTATLTTDVASNKPGQHIAGVWDLKLTSGGGVTTRVLEGEVQVNPAVTR